MISVSKDFNKYYKEHIMIKGDIINDLREKKRKNIDRLESGIKKYNEENNKKYKIIDLLEQGSVAMSTLVQSDEDYDIDVAVAFDKNDFNNGSGASKNIFIDIVKTTTANFKTSPEKLTNCIRIYYEDGYHLDFALFRCDDYGKYEHAGSEWTERNPRAVNNWFMEKNEDNKLRKFTRLIKFFCKKRSNMPGGFILTILVQEALVKVNNTSNEEITLIDICKSINTRLDGNKDISNPTPPYNNLTEKEKYKDQLRSLNTKLKYIIEKYDSCDNTRKAAIIFWADFFKDKEYWNDDKLSEQNNESGNHLSNYEDNEDMIENYYPLLTRNNRITIKCQKLVEQSTNPQNTNTTIIWSQPDEAFKLSQQRYRQLKFEVIIPNNISYDNVLWKVKNNGYNAKIKNSLRGELYECTSDRCRVEPIAFEGNHYVECYVIKDNKCVAKEKYNVKIEN